MKTNMKSVRKNEISKIEHHVKAFIIRFFKWIIIIGISYIILGPVIAIISKTFLSIEDAYNPLVYLIPIKPTLANLTKAFEKLKYVRTLSETILFVFSLMGIQALVCSIVGYGFARFKFPGKNILFAGVLLTIIVPTHTIMVPLYSQFRYFDFFGIISLLAGTENGVSILNTKIPMVLMTFTGMGLRAGLFIYIFRQFFRGMPKEIEEAALIDGASVFKTFFQIMLPNAVPSIITVLIFSMVWQYNDTFFSALFMPNSNFLSLQITTLSGSLGLIDKINDPRHVELIINAAVFLTIAPVVLIYVFLQRFFMEGIERSGIVG